MPEQEPIKTPESTTDITPQKDVALGQETYLNTEESGKVKNFVQEKVNPRWMRVSNISNGKTVQVKVFDDTTAATTGDGKVIFFIPEWWNGLSLVDCDAYVTGASSSGALTIQIRNITKAVDMLSTAITIDVSELSSLTAATASVINYSNNTVASGDQIAIDVDGAGTSAEGLGVVLLFG